MVLVFGPTLIAAGLSKFYRSYLRRCSSEVAELVSFLYFHGRSSCYYDRLDLFLLNMPWCCKVYVNSSSPRTAKLWNSLSRECLPLLITGPKNEVFHQGFFQ